MSRGLVGGQSGRELTVNSDMPRHGVRAPLVIRREPDGDGQGGRSPGSDLSRATGSLPASDPAAKTDAGRGIVPPIPPLGDSPKEQGDNPPTYEQTVSFMRKRGNIPSSERDVVAQGFDSFVDGVIGSELLGDISEKSGGVSIRDFDLYNVQFQELEILKRVDLRNPGEHIEIRITRQLDDGRPRIVVTHLLDDRLRNPGDPPREKENHIYTIELEGEYAGSVVRRDQDWQEIYKRNKETEEGVYSGNPPESERAFRHFETSVQDYMGLIKHPVGIEEFRGLMSLVDRAAFWGNK